VKEVKTNNPKTTSAVGLNHSHRKDWMNYKGTIIKESLENKDILKNVRILSTKVEKVIKEHQTPWLKQWTLHKVEVEESKVEEISKKISQSIDSRHNHSWYADYKNDTWHYIIFPHKIFKIDRKSDEQYAEARKYGISLGIPEYQVDFSPEIK
jgi:hypothetical protein